MLHPPPFKLASATAATAAVFPSAAGSCCGDGEQADAAAAQARTRLGDLHQHVHCSVLGTCLATTDLRKLLSRFIDVRGATDLEVHHEAVRLTGDDAQVAKALHKVLDKRHDAVIQRYARTRDAQALTGLWEEALRLGEIPGAYWAVLTHRAASEELRQRAFGDVHMLSHLVGAANRADIRRLVALERDNAELRDRLEREQARSQHWLDERDAALARLQQQAVATAPQPLPAETRTDADAAAQTELVAAQTVRRERAEAATAVAEAHAQGLQQELDHLQAQVHALGRELAAAEAQLRAASDADASAGSASALAERLRGRRILYVGGRPSSMPAIRDLVLSHGGEFQKHDGGPEDRKGLLEAGVGWAEFVLFPVDCIDHDSAGRLKRLCTRLGTPYVPLRSAGVASFAAAVHDLDDTRSPGFEARQPAICLRHG